MFLFTGEAPKLPEPIQIVIEQKVEEPKKKETEITWKDNPNDCDESIEWIAKEKPFYCIPHTRSVYNAPRASSNSQTANSTTSTIKPVRTAVNSSHGYTFGYCTEWVASNRYVPNGWGNAISWKYNAINAGWTVSDKPIVGAIAYEPIGGLGHVALVESVNGDTVTVSEKNYRGWNVVSRRTVPISKFTYLY